MKIEYEASRERKQLEMRVKKVMVLSAMLLSVVAMGQAVDKTLFSINGAAVPSSEFIRVFEKNKDIVIEEEPKDFEDYFNLFVDFKLKLTQARDIKLDTNSNYISELKVYREQLIQPYLQNPTATEALVKEAYERTVEEVSASHILVLCEPTATAQDTLKAFIKISEARQELIEGIDFSLVAQNYSEDPSVKLNNGDLGYFSAFSMVYPFENAAYNTAVGKVSEPFRTKFGYHIVKVNDRRKSPGEVQASHIMVNNDSTDAAYAENKIKEIYQKLEQGGDFARIAREHSDDRSSAQKGGVLPKFGPGRMIKSFEDTAFDLEEGKYSAPFNTTYGWHILKLLKKFPVPGYEELHEKLASKVKNGSRSTYVEKSFADSIANQYSIRDYQSDQLIHPNILAYENGTDTILTIQDTTYVENDFFEFSEAYAEENIVDVYTDFKTKMLINYYKDHLEETNSEFRLTYQEYKDGLLLFELLQKEVWEKAEQDSLGLQTYFENNRDNYAWKTRGKLTIASCTQLKDANKVKTLLIENVDLDSIKSSLNEGARINVLFSQGILEEGSSKLPANYVFSEGVSEIYESEKDNFTILKVDTIFAPKLKDLKETRGEVMNDYQNYLETKWVEQLRKTYAVKVNQTAYNELKTHLEGE